ncbi:hypothetical protein, partial [Pseudomonas syringae]|uniref:hypothetical protein n=1 Tax=Pseudomonas syringae TaxID=317 RepID=UPI001ABA260D
RAEAQIFIHLKACEMLAECGLCGSELARELPGTGSKTGAHGTSGATEVAGFQGVSQPNIQPRR